WCADRGVPILSYAPLEQGRLRDHPTLVQVASAHGVTPSQVALAWVLHQDGVGAIVRSARTSHVRQNRAAVDLTLSDRFLAKLERACPPPIRTRPLEML